VGSRRHLKVRRLRIGEDRAYPGNSTSGPMTVSLITNIVFAALVLVAIPGMLAWAIRTSRNDGPPRHHAVRRPMPRPHFPAPRLSFGHRSGAAARAPVEDVH
jgi:hypothetical protein